VKTSSFGLLLLVTTLGWLLVPGCQAFHAYRPAPIQAIDAETKQPIPSAHVHVSYPLSKSSFAPHEAAGVTGTDGVVRLDVAPYGDAGTLIEVSANGYLSEQKYLTITQVSGIEPAHFFEDVSKRPAAVIVEVLAGPKPSVELVVPVGYHGRVKANMQVRDDLPLPPGQRCFSYLVSTIGEVEVLGPSLLNRVMPCDVHARTDAGPLPDRPDGEQTVGFWFLKRDGTTYIYVVGDRNEYEDARRAVERDDALRPTGSSKGSGGGRGHGKRGRGGQGQSASDPNNP
jgi:hypothetical protein